MELFVPIVLAILFSYALDPLVTSLSRLRVPRAVSAAAVLIAVISVFGYISYQLRNQAVTAIESLPEAAEQIKELLATPPTGKPTDAVGKIQRAAQQVENAVAEATKDSSSEVSKVPKVRIEAPAFNSGTFLWSGSMGLLNALSESVLVLSLTLFLLASGDLFKRKFITAIGDRLSTKRVTLEAINEMNRQIEQFLFMQVLTGVIVAAGTALILWGLGVGQPLVWGLVAGVTSVVPYFGAMVAVGAIVLVTFLQAGTIALPLEVAAAMLVFRTIESMFLIPALMGKAAGMNGVAIFIGLLFWGWAWGTIGLIVAIPLMMVCKIACDRIEGLHFFGEMLGERATKG
jgi:predicted PurR-regulated permease PerM